jgi:hypothetical protein
VAFDVPERFRCDAHNTAIMRVSDDRRLTVVAVGVGGASSGLAAVIADVLHRRARYVLVRPLARGRRHNEL